MMPKGRPVCPYREVARQSGVPRYADACGIERFTSSGNSVIAKREWDTVRRRALGVQSPTAKAAPETIAAKNVANVKRWRKENPHGRASLQRTYRARRKGSHGRHNKHHVQLLMEKQDGQCFYCAGPMEPVTWDHFIPMSRGGENTVDNGRLACHPCNTLKNDALPRDFFIRLWCIL